MPWNELRGSPLLFTIGARVAEGQLLALALAELGCTGRGGARAGLGHGTREQKGAKGERSSLRLPPCAAPSGGPRCAWPLVACSSSGGRDSGAAARNGVGSRRSARAAAHAPVHSRLPGTTSIGGFLDMVVLFVCRRHRLCFCWLLKALRSGYMYRRGGGAHIVATIDPK